MVDYLTLHRNLRATNAGAKGVFSATAVAVALILTSVATVQRAEAFDILPEYQGLSEQELERFEIPSEIDSEYQSAFNAYMPGIDWEQRWHQQNKVLDLTIGSVGNKHFMHNSRLKLEADLLENLRFRFSSFVQRDREIDQSRHMLELIQRISPNFSVSGYGEPSLYKRENDMGFALWWTTDKSETRAYYTLHDFTRKDHNDQDDRFRGQEPHSMGVTTLWQTEKVWLRAGLRYDQPIKWVRPQEDRVFSYSKKLAFSDLVARVNTESHFILRAQWDQTYKGENPDAATSTVTENNWLLERRFLRLGFLRGQANDFLQAELALAHVQRLWTKNANEKMQHFNTLPSITTKLRGLRADSADRVIFGYEANVFNMFGDLALTSALQKRNAVEHRLQTAYQWQFRDSASLILALNFDLDDWRTTPTFEGGNGQFRAEF